MTDKEIFVLKIVWKKSIASLHCLTQAVQRANLRRTAGDPTWVYSIIIRRFDFVNNLNIVSLRIINFCYYHVKHDLRNVWQ